jgi:type I restriction-modification system DNA methylase subunit
MGLFEHVRLDYGRGITAHEEAGRFIPITRIRNSKELSDFIVNVIPLLHAEPAQVDPKVNLHPDAIDNFTMGTIFEELIRKFNEALNENPGEHFTPRDVVHLTRTFR